MKGERYMILRASESAEEHKPKVLIVDDEPQIVEFLRVGFGYEGFSVAVATTGPEALRSITAEQPDIIILDIMLPKLDGMAVTRQVRKAHDTVIIMLTAKDEI